MGNAASAVEHAKQQGNTLFAKGDYAGAAALYRKALAGNVQVHALQANIAACCLHGGLLAAALAAADAAVAAKPDWPKGHYRRGSAFAAAGLWHEAALSFARALSVDPNNQQLQQALAEARVQQGTAKLGGASCLTWGRGDFGALGQGDLKDKGFPKAVEALRGIRLVDVACGTGHNLVLSAEGDVWAWGWNVKGQCGVRDGGEALPTPQLVGGLLGEGVSGVACGAAHSLAVTERGEVLSWGLGGSGQLGLGERVSGVLPVPQRLGGLSTELVRGVACGFGHSLALGRSGGVFSWGWNRDGQLGLGDTQNRFEPCRIGALPGAIAHVACGGAHSAAVSVKGELFTFGANSCGQLGLGEANWQAADVTRPTLVTSLKERGVCCVLAECGEEFSLVISESQEVFAFGLGNVGQMGDATARSSSSPQRVEAMDGKGGESASCGAAEAYVVGAEGKVWAWGLATTDTQQLAAEMQAVALPNPTPEGAPKPLPDAALREVSALRQRRTLRLEAGRRHFCALACPASPRHSTLSPEAFFSPPVALVAGRRAKLTLAVRDDLGRRATAGGERVCVRLIREGDEAELPSERGGEAEQHSYTSAEVDDLMDGSYEILLRPQREGPFQLWVLLNGGHVLGSPISLSVVAASARAQNCTLTPPSAAVVAAEPLPLALTLRDGFGNALTETPRELPLQLRCELALAAAASTDAAAADTADTTDATAHAAAHAAAAAAAAAAPPPSHAAPSLSHEVLADGTVAITFSSEAAGRYLVHATLGGETVQGSPCAVLVRPGDAVAAHSSVPALATLREVQAGRAAALCLLLRDAYRNPTSDADVSLTLAYAGGGSGASDAGGDDAEPPPPPPRLNRAAEPSANGELACSFTPQKAGELSLTIQVGGEALACSPARLTVTAGEALATRCLLLGEGLSGGHVPRSGASRALRLKAFDAFGNRCTAGGAQLSLTLRAHLEDDQEGGKAARRSRPSSAGAVRGTVEDGGDGSYALSYRALPGRWTLCVEVGGRAVPPTPSLVAFTRDPEEEAELRRREAEAAARRQKELDEAARCKAEAEAAAAAASMEAARCEIEARLVREAERAEHQREREEAKAAKRAAQQEEKQRRVMALLRREEETRRRAEAALAALQEERERQAAELERRKTSTTKRTGGGFVVSYRPGSAK